MIDKVRQDVATAFEYSYLHDDWVCPLQEALEGVAVEQALWSASPSGGCIWEIVLHLAVWNEVMVKRIESGVNEPPTDGAWPALPNDKNGDGWQAAQKRLWKSLGALQQLIETVDWKKVEASPYGLPDLLCRLTHNGYHLGQIEKLLEFQPRAI